MVLQAGKAHAPYLLGPGRGENWLRLPPEWKSSFPNDWADTASPLRSCIDLNLKDSCLFPPFHPASSSLANRGGKLPEQTSLRWPRMERKGETPLLNGKGGKIVPLRAQSSHTTAHFAIVRGRQLRPRESGVTCNSPNSCRTPIASCMSILNSPRH